VIATYRLQLTPQFDFVAAQKVLPYLQRLGISHVYLSPLTEARPGSQHGYDVVEHNTVREELGGALQLQLFLARVKQLNLKVIVDIVPNHAGLGPQNAAWQDVLCYGQASPAARFFDIEWQPHKQELREKILLPFLGKNYGDALAAREVGLCAAGGRLYVTYFAHRFAVNPHSYNTILGLILPHCAPQEHSQQPEQRQKQSHKQEQGQQHEQEQKQAQSIAAAWQALRPQFAAWQPVDREGGEALLQRFVSDTGQSVEGVDALFNSAYAAAAQALDVATLHAILQQQHHRLANWRTASHEVNYRRFFEINDLIGLRMEDPRVFSATHRLVKELLCDDVVDGLRIDHIDGLADPQVYLQRLQTLGARRVWVEKILAADESLPKAWPCMGTTGYEFGADVLTAFTCRRGKKQLTTLYRRYVEDACDFSEEVRRSKRLIMTTKLASELQRLAQQLDRLSEASIYSRDFTLQALREALVEIIAVLPRYRTYLPHQPQEAAELLAQAVVQAAANNLAVDGSIYRFIGAQLTAADSAPLHASFVTRFQQYTAPVMAKGVEDTAFFRNTAFVALNEVGCSPLQGGCSVAQLHARLGLRGRTLPDNFNATATHDSKRGEDTRMRLVGISEDVDAWERLLRGVHLLTRQFVVDGCPSRADRTLFFQMWAALYEPPQRRGPQLCKRLQAMLVKSAREAKRQTSWTNPSAPYEQRLQQFAEKVMADAASDALFAAYAAPLQRAGLLNGLSQLVLKCTVPGVPDFYQGSEWLHLCMLDPDNRQPIDFSARAAQLQGLQGLLQKPSVKEVLNLLHSDPDAMKLYVTAQLLAARRSCEALQGGSFEGLPAEGGAAEHLIAYARGTAVVVVTRLHTLLKHHGGLRDTHLPLPRRLGHKTYRDCLTGATVKCAAGLNPSDLPLPWAVLVP
jgi:(1->4)-alpha-D-glucan 1-alpha-D-glucosylmutase